MSRYGYGAIRYVLRYMYHDRYVSRYIYYPLIYEMQNCVIEVSIRIYYNIWGNTYHDTIFSLAIRIVGAVYRYIVIHWWIVTSLFCSALTAIRNSVKLTTYTYLSHMAYPNDEQQCMCALHWSCWSHLPLWRHENRYHKSDVFHATLIVQCHF